MPEESKNDDPTVDLSQLRQILITYLSDDELRDLTFELNIDYDSLSGEGKKGKARELIIYCQRRNRIPNLITIGQSLRPEIKWPALSQNVIPDSTKPTTNVPSKTIDYLRDPVADFVGRAAEIKELVEILSKAALETTGVTAVVRGLGGLGKTQLVNKVAQQLRTKFPDGLLFLELQGVSKNATPPERVIQQVIQTFEPQAQVPETLDELQRFYRSILNNKRVLIIADNAKDEAQVRSLEPPPGCALLVTSRQRFSLPGAHVLNLTALPYNEAEELILKLCPRIETSAYRLAELCGRLPLALRVSASLLGNDETQNITRYIQALEKERLHYLRDPENPDDPNASVSASLNLSYIALNDARQRILRQISVFHTSFDLEAAKAVISLQGVKAGAGDEREVQAEREAKEQDAPPPAPTVRMRGRGVLPRVEESLGILYRRSLVEYDTAAERYNLHDLVREFAAERLKTPDEQIRYVRHYLAVAQKANLLYSRGYEQTIEGLSLFDSERPHIDASWEWLRHQPDNSLVDDLILSFSEATSKLGDLRYDKVRDLIPQFELSLRSSERLKRREDQAKALRGLGFTYIEVGEAQRAIEILEQSLNMYKSIDNPQGEGNVLNSIGWAYYVLGNLSHSAEYYKQVLSLFNKNRAIIRGAMNNLGLIYIGLGDSERAIHSLEKALKLYQEAGVRDGESSALGNLGMAHIVAGDTSQGLSLCERSLAIKKQLGNRWDEGHALHFLGLAYAADGEIQRATEIQEYALTITRETGHRRLESQILNALGEVNIDQNNLLVAIDQLNQSLFIAHQISDRQGEAIASWNLGLAHERQGDLARAAELMQVRVDYEREIGHLKAEEKAAQLAEVRAQLEVK